MAVRRDNDGHLRWIDSKKTEFLSSLINKQRSVFIDLFRRNTGRGLVNYLLRIIKVVHPSLSSSVVIQVVMFSRFCYKLWRTRGYKGLTLYLKACQVLLQQSIGGYKVSDLQELKCRPKRNRYGSPCIIHRRMRSLLHNKNQRSIIMMYMTLFGVYRVLEFKGSLKLETITEPFSLRHSTLNKFSKYIQESFPLFLNRYVKDIKVSKPTIRPIQTSSPTSNIERDLFPTGGKSVISTNLSSLWLASVLWKQSDSFKGLKSFSEMMNAPTFIERINLVADATPYFSSKSNSSNYREATLLDKSKTQSRDKIVTKIGNFNYIEYAEGYLGKLALKYEAAGKIRVFAMVDAWTQWIMSPLHELLFDILRTLPCDGTFNQTRPIYRLLSKLGNPKGFVPKRTFYSLDLSAATDRLPIALQTKIIALIYDMFIAKSFTFPYKYSESALKFAELWRELLVDRTYTLTLSKNDLQKIKGKKQIFYKLWYAVGQPMGALSSWAMLAMVHHAIVQFCSSRVGIRNFDEYAILGDDIIIANSKVAKVYLSFLQEIGVKIGLAKSIISKRKVCLEFAKKFFVNSEQADMVPLKDCFACWVSNSLVKEFGVKWKLNPSILLSFLGYGYKSKMRAMNKDLWDLNSRVRLNLVWWSTPGVNSPVLDWFNWVSLKSLYSSYKVEDPKLLLEILNISLELYLEKYSRIVKLQYKWGNSLELISKDGNARYPTYKIVTSVSTGMEKYYSDTVHISWIDILTKPFDFSFFSEENSSYTLIRFLEGQYEYHDKRDYNPYKKDLVLIMEEYYSIHDRITSLLGREFDLNSCKEVINFILSKLFLELSGTIPSSFWPKTRKVEGLFDDFNDTYSKWVKLNAPIARFYSKKRKGLLRDNRIALEPDGGFPLSKETAIVPVHGTQRELSYPVPFKSMVVNRFSIYYKTINWVDAGSNGVISKFYLIWPIIFDKVKDLFLTLLLFCSFLVSALAFWPYYTPDIQYLSFPEGREVWKYHVIHEVSEAGRPIWEPIIIILVIFSFGLLFVYLYELYFRSLALEQELKLAEAQAKKVIENFNNLKTDYSSLELKFDNLEALYKQCERGLIESNERYISDLDIWTLERRRLLDECRRLLERDNLFSDNRLSIIEDTESRFNILDERLKSIRSQAGEGALSSQDIQNMIGLIQSDKEATLSRIAWLVDERNMSSLDTSLHLTEKVIAHVARSPEVVTDGFLSRLASHFMFYYDLTSEQILSFIFLP